MGPWSNKEFAAWVDFKTGTRWIVGALIAGLSIAILWGFLKVLLWATIIAVATWPIYRRFARHMPSSMASNVTPLLFTVLVALVVLGPPVFAFGTLAAHARTWVGTMLAASSEFVAPGLAVHRARGWAQSGRTSPHWRRT